MSNQTVYLSGATGFIGGRLAQRLLARGDRVRCLVRSPERAESLRAAGAELIRGDITDAAAVRSALHGVDLAFHLAAIYDMGVVDAAALEKTNVTGTAVFLDAVKSENIPRSVYVSTTVALGPSGEGESDNIEAYKGPYPSQYHRTKAEAHARARAAQAAGLPLVIACPAYVYGPGDQGPGGHFIKDLLHYRIPGLLSRPSWFSYVHVDDVVDGLIAAGDRGRTGDVYVLGGEAASVNSYAERVAKLGGVRAPFLRFPPVMARLTGVAMDAVGRLTGWRLPISRENVDSTAYDRWIHSFARTSRELGYKPRSLQEGLPETVAWFKRTG